MIGRETRMLLRHYLEQGASKSALARPFGVSRDTVHRWIRAGDLDRDLDTTRRRKFIADSGGDDSIVICRVAHGELVRARMTCSISVLIASAISRWTIANVPGRSGAPPRPKSRARSWASSSICFRRVASDTTRAMRHIVNPWPPISLSGPRQVLLLLEESPCRARPICFMAGMRRGRQHVCRNPVRKFGGCGRGRTGAVV